MTARVSLTPPASSTLEAVQEHFKERLGVGLEPVNALGHQPEVLRAVVALERRTEAWDTVPAQLKELAVMAAAAKVGCSWCIDFGYWAGVAHGVPVVKLEAVPGWRDSDLFDDLERRVLEYAEAMTDTPPTTTDDMVAGLLDHLTEPQLVELTVMIGIENQRSRINAALGLATQGFKQHCDIRGEGA